MRGRGKTCLKGWKIGWRAALLGSEPGGLDGAQPRGQPSGRARLDKANRPAVQVDSDVLRARGRCERGRCRHHTQAGRHLTTPEMLFIQLNPDRADKVPCESDTSDADGMFCSWCSSCLVGGQSHEGCTTGSLQVVSPRDHSIRTSGFQKDDTRKHLQGVWSHRCHGVLDILGAVGRRRNDAACSGEVTQQAAGRAVGRVHRAQEAPGLRQQLTHGRGAQLRKVRAAVDCPEVRQVPGGQALILKVQQSCISWFSQCARQVFVQLRSWLWRCLISGLSASARNLSTQLILQWHNLCITQA